MCFLQIQKHFIRRGILSNLQMFGESVEMLAFQSSYRWQNDACCVPSGLPVTGGCWCTKTTCCRGWWWWFSFLFLHRETTSGVRSWSSLQRPHSTTGIKSSAALCPNSRWGSKTRPRECETSAKSLFFLLFVLYLFLDLVFEYSSSSPLGINKVSIYLGRSQ